MQLTYAIIHDEHVWEYEEETTVKDESFPSVPHPLYLNIPCIFATFDSPCENSFPDVSTFDCSQDTSDVSLSLHCGEDTSSSENPSNLSSIISKNTEGEHPCFSSTPLHDSSNHEDANKHPEFSDLGCRNLSTFSSDHDVDSIIDNLSKALAYNDLSVHEVGTPQTVEELQPKLMFILGPHFPEVGLTPGQEIVETLKAPHHSLLCTKYQPNT